MQSLKVSSAARTFSMSTSRSKSEPRRACHMVMMSGWQVPPETGAMERSMPSAPPSRAAR